MRRGRFYDRWFADHGWTVAAGWQQIASGWHARFEMRSHAPALAVDIRLGNRFARPVDAGW